MPKILVSIFGLSAIAKKICAKVALILIFDNQYFISVMTDSIFIADGTKQEQYESLLPQLKALFTAEPDIIANMANCSAAIKMQFNWLWVGFYVVKDNELVLGPFQGPIACTRIALGKGVCGTSWQQKQTLIVPDVNAFPGHIACSSLSKSEIVVPVFDKQKNVIAVLDIDSDKLNSFDEADALFLAQIVQLLQ